LVDEGNGVVHLRGPGLQVTKKSVQRHCYFIKRNFVQRNM